MKTMNMIRKLAVLICATLCISCEPEIGPHRVYTIRQGNHYCDGRVPESVQSPVLSFTAMFDESAVYDFADDGLQDSKNKLMGFSDCNALHHQNSARFAWQWYNSQLEIYAYCYVNGERKEAFLGVVPLNEYQQYRLEVTSAEYVFNLNDRAVAISRGDVCNTGSYSLLWPYFGGRLPAPHDIHISIARQW